MASRSPLPFSARERFLETILDSATEFAILTLDLKGRISSWNNGAEAVFGWTEAEALGDPGHIIFTPEDRADGVPEQELACAREKGRAADERWHVCKDGRRFWASGSMVPLFDELSGNHEGYLKILRDRTRERLASDVMSEQRQTLQTVTDHIGEAVFQLDSAGRITFANPAAEQMFGWRADEMLGQDLHQLLHHSHPDGQPYSTEECPFVQSLRRGETIRDHEDVFFHKHGSSRSVLATSATVSQAGQSNGAVMTVRDITQRKATEQQLTDSEARWRGLFTGMQEGFHRGEIIRDEAGHACDFRFLELNPAFATQTGLPISSSGRTVREVIPSIQQEVIDTYARVVDTGEPITFETHVPALGRWFEVRTRKDEGECFASLFLNITRRKQNELRQAALIELGDRLRDLDDEPAIVAATAEIMGHTLGADRAGYSAVDPVQEAIMVAQDWARAGLPSVAGLHQFRDYGSYIENLLAGEVVIIADAEHDPRTAADAAALIDINARALLNLPVLEHGRLVASFFVTKGAAYTWSSQDVTFVQAVADRARGAIRRVQAEEQQAVLNRELSHRMKNLLAMVQAITMQTMRNATDLEQARETLAARLIALGKGHDILLEHEYKGASLAEVVRSAVALHDDGQPGRFQISGPEVHTGPSAALSLSLMLHELGTNAAKYGALSTAGGQVVLLWTIDQTEVEPLVRLCWAEQGGPPVTPPSRKGFGSRLIERGLAGAVGGNITLAFEPTGLVCNVEAPLAAFQAAT
ncbi:PAS domain-containing sensor histidine kinase [Methylobacterium segetis]|uniref:PAS domain-containing sensor histidine kinase n=1 Tax=Methylobacterium segetis TaxID=2488750 RepID=UPI00247AB27E|nr:PAS domain S-box protein [Methylobacterium segetis]